MAYRFIPQNVGENKEDFSFATEIGEVRLKGRALHLLAQEVGLVASDGLFTIVDGRVQDERNAYFQKVVHGQLGEHRAAGSKAGHPTVITTFQHELFKGSGPAKKALLDPRRTIQRESTMSSFERMRRESYALPSVKEECAMLCRVELLRQMYISYYALNGEFYSSKSATRRIARQATKFATGHLMSNDSVVGNRVNGCLDFVFVEPAQLAARNSKER